METFGTQKIASRFHHDLVSCSAAYRAFDAVSVLSYTNEADDGNGGDDANGEGDANGRAETIDDGDNTKDKDKRYLAPLKAAAFVAFFAASITLEAAALASHEFASAATTREIAADDATPASQELTAAHDNGSSTC